MPFNTKSEIPKKIFQQILLLITFTAILVFALFHLAPIFSAITAFFQLISPVLIGFAIAFVLNLLVKFFENKVFISKKTKKTLIKRPLSILLAITVILVIITILVFLLYPQIKSSVLLFTTNAPNYINTLYSKINGFLEGFPTAKTIFSENWDKLLLNSATFLTNLISSLFTMTINLTSGIITVFISIIFSIYLLAGKEKLIVSLKKCLFAFLSEEKAEKIIYVGSLINDTFSKFVSGQIIEAVILGSLCFIGMLLFRFDYAILISTIIGLTALIPIFGAFIGAGIGAFILLLISPLSSLCFLIFIIVLQQIEGNVIYPKVVGTSIGLSGFWVLIAITVFGGLYGIPGILLGIPLFSVFSTLFTRAVDKKIQSKNINIH